MHCCNSVWPSYLQVVMLLQTVFNGLISACGRPLNSLHCLLPTPTGLTAHNLMLFTAMVQRYPTVTLSPTSCQQAHLITASDIVSHASSLCAVNGLLCL